MRILEPPAALEEALPVRRAPPGAPLPGAADRARAVLRLSALVDPGAPYSGVEPPDLLFAVAAGLALERHDVLAPEAATAPLSGLARGLPLRQVLAATEASRPPTSADPCVLPSSASSPASHLPHAVGAAWARRRQGAPSVALASLGAEATPEPGLHAALNFAAVLGAPVVFFALARAPAAASPGLAARALTYGLPAERARASDLEALAAALADAVAHARATGEPALVEAIPDPGHAFDLRPETLRRLAVQAGLMPEDVPLERDAAKAELTRARPSPLSRSKGG